MKHFNSLLYALGQLSEYAKGYINSKKKIIQLSLTDQVTKILSKIISRIIVFILVFFLILFGSLTISIGLSMYFNSFIAGFGVVTGIYLVLIGLVVIFRRALITNPIINMILKDFD